MNVQYNSAAPKKTVSLGAGPPQVERGSVIKKGFGSFDKLEPAD